LTILRKFFYTSVMLVSVFTVPTAKAMEAELCSRFENLEIDQSLIAGMLRAAEDGYLYRIKPNSSQMGFRVSSPIGLVTGNFQKFQGGMALEGSNNQTLVSIDTNSLVINGLPIEKLLKSDVFFDVKNFPDMLFISSSFEWLSNTRGVLKGELSLHGITKPVAFYVEINEVDGELVDSDTITVEASTTVQRSEFGMHTLLSMVGDKVHLFMSIEAERYRSL